MLLWREGEHRSCNTNTHAASHDIYHLCVPYGGVRQTNTAVRSRASDNATRVLRHPLLAWNMGGMYSPLSFFSLSLSPLLVDNRWRHIMRVAYERKSSSLSCCSPFYLHLTLSLRQAPFSTPYIYQPFTFFSLHPLSLLFLSRASTPVYDAYERPRDHVLKHTFFSIFSLIFLFFSLGKAQFVLKGTAQIL